MDARDLDPDPIAQFGVWLEEAERVSPSPLAMTVATATTSGRPSARIVLLRTFDARGFGFFSNRESRKGSELERNPRAALVFHWWELGRQVRVEGAVEMLSDTETEAYWSTRPRASRIAAWASPQSRPLSSREELDGLYASAERRLGGGEVALPPYWGGYRVVPETIEFWLHRENRLHDRVRYERRACGWRRERLAP